MTDAASEDGSEGSESESEGEDIEGVEFQREEESSDEETSQDRAMLDDASQDEQKHVVQAGLINAARRDGGDSDSEDLSQILRGRFKPRAPANALKSRAPLGTRRRGRVLESSSDSSAEESGPSRDQSLPAAEMDVDSEERAPLEAPADNAGGAQQWGLARPPPEHDWHDDDWVDDGWPDLLDLSLRDEFDDKCMIVPPRPKNGAQVRSLL
jgi:hypothetical protein